MACMAHDCPRCGYATENNKPGPLECPVCGERMTWTFDKVDGCDPDEGWDDQPDDPDIDDDDES